MLGIEHIPHRPVVFAGNHSRYALLDLPFMMGELWMRRRIVIRGLGEHLHYSIPVWRDLLTIAGMVRRTREHVRAVMRNGQNILVFQAGQARCGRGADRTTGCCGRSGWASRG